MATFKFASDAQRNGYKLLASDKNVLLAGGARSGKSFLIVRAVIMRALKAAESNHLFLRKYFGLAKRALAEETIPNVFKLCYPGLLEMTEFNASAIRWTLPNGSTLHIGGLGEPSSVDKILGTEYSTIVFDEATEMQESTINVARSRLAQKNCLIKRSYFTCNPVHKKHWLYKMFIDPGTVNHSFGYINPKDNLSNIDEDFIKTLETQPLADRLRFLEGQWADLTNGGIFQQAFIDSNRILPSDVPKLEYKLVAIDPAVTSKSTSDSTGICVLGIDKSGIVYILESISRKFTADEWSKLACGLAEKYDANELLVETNQGADLLLDVLKKYTKKRVNGIHASESKSDRARPIAGLCEQGFVKFAGQFNQLEQEMITFDGFGASPNEMDAMVHGATKVRKLWNEHNNRRVPSLARI